jgi:hypothetical protein
MDARPLDVLEESRNEHHHAVRHSVDVDLDALEIAVDPDGPIGVNDRRRRELPDEILGRVAEVDRETTDDERRTDDHRVPDPLGERQRLLDAVCHAAFRLRDPEPVEEGREPRPVLRLVDRLEIAAEERHATGCERRRQVERRLAAEGDHRGKRGPAVGRLGIDDRSHALRVEGLEVQPRRRVEVGRHGLRVRVDHHRLPAGATKRVGRVDGAVVELDPLPDPNRAAADDECRRAPDRRRLRR